MRNRRTGTTPNVRWSACGPEPIDSVVTAQQVYEVIEAFGSVEVRRYERCVIAEVDVDASFESAGNKGFRPLFSFITGANDTGEKVAMTAPVLQDVKGSESDGGSYSVSFVMPAGSDRDSMPQPTDGSVILRDVGEFTALATRWSGRWTKPTFDAHVARLADVARVHGLVLVGAPRFARYNPPWTPWFMRRNEVIWDIDTAT